VADVVLDASALLCLLGAEPGADEVAQALPGAAISTVNLAEVVAKLADASMPEADIHAALESLGLEVVPFDASLAYRSGLLRRSTKSAGLSLGDRACLSLAAARDLPAVTTDRSWRGIRIGIEIRVVR